MLRDLDVAMAAGSSSGCDSLDGDGHDDVLRALTRSLGIGGSVLSLHFDDDPTGKELHRTGAASGDDRLALTILERASAIADRGPCSEDEAVDRAWLCRLDGADRQLLRIIFRHAPSRTKMVFSAVFDRDNSPDRRLVAATLRRLLPMLDAYFTLWQRHRHAARLNDSMRSALDSIDFGVVLVDRDGSPSFANAAGTALLADGRFLRRRGAAVHANSFNDTLRLQAAIAAAITGDSAEGAGRATADPVSAQLKLTSGDDHLIVAVLPVQRRADEPGAAAAMLIILKPDAEPEKVAAPVCKIFGLSGVETRLACQLVTGRSLAEACETLRIRETTGRGYLKQIFAKLNVNRQAELVRVLLSSIVRARSKGLIQVI